MRLKHTNKLLCTILVLFILFSSGIAVLADGPAIPSPTREFYSNDFANVLSSNVEQQIIDLGEATEAKSSGGQVVFVSIQSVEDSTIEEYSNTLFNKWGIGTDDKGILFILSMDEKYSRIEVGYGYEGVMTDLESYNLLQKFSQLNSSNGLEEAVMTIYQDICLIVTGDIDRVEFPEYTNDNNASTSDKDRIISFILKNPIVFIIVGVLILLDIILTRGRITWFIIRMIAMNSRRGGGGGNSGGGGRSGGGGSSSGF